MNEITGTVTLSVDDDGFLRRECPNCERQFKWLHGDHGEPMPKGGYHCPYCNHQAADGWWTKAQLDLIEKTIGATFEDQMYDMLKRLEESSSDSLEIRVSRSPTAPIPRVPDEPNDMRRVDCACHPAEPAKVLDEWAEPVHCLICGTAAR